MSGDTLLSILCRRSFRSEKGGLYWLVELGGEKRGEMWGRLAWRCSCCLWFEIARLLLIRRLWLALSSYIFGMRLGKWANTLALLGAAGDSWLVKADERGMVCEASQSITNRSWSFKALSRAPTAWNSIVLLDLIFLAPCEEAKLPWMLLNQTSKSFWSLHGCPWSLTWNSLMFGFLANDISWYSFRRFVLIWPFSSKRSEAFFSPIHSHTKQNTFCRWLSWWSWLAWWSHVELNRRGRWDSLLGTFMDVLLPVELVEPQTETV